MVQSEVFAIRALDVIGRMPSATTDSHALELLHVAKDVFGVDHLVFASFVRDDDSRESFRFLVASDPTWCLDYQQHGWYANDPWLLYAATHSEPATDSQIFSLTRSQQKSLSLARLHGVASAYIVPAPPRNELTRMGALMVGSRAPHYFDCQGLASLRVFARSLAMELHDWWVAKIRAEIIAAHQITEDDLELLRLEQRGWRTKTIASAQGATVAAIDSRFQRLNAKLGMPSRKLAARLAAEYGLI